VEVLRVVENGCPFCEPHASRRFHEGEGIVGLWDGFPVAAGHALLVPKRHVATWFDATPEEQHELVDGIAEAKRVIETQHQPDGYTVGINIGEAAGQTVFHLHLHVIPRYFGDVSAPRGGVRGVIPSKQSY